MTSRRDGRHRVIAPLWKLIVERYGARRSGLPHRVPLVHFRRGTLRPHARAASDARPQPAVYHIAVSVHLSAESPISGRHRRGSQPPAARVHHAPARSIERRMGTIAGTPHQVATAAGRARVISPRALFFPALHAPRLPAASPAQVSRARPTARFGAAAAFPLDIPFSRPRVLARPAPMPREAGGQPNLAPVSVAWRQGARASSAGSGVPPAASTEFLERASASFMQSAAATGSFERSSASFARALTQRSRAQTVSIPSGRMPAVRAPQTARRSPAPPAEAAAGGLRQPHRSVSSALEEHRRAAAIVNRGLDGRRHLFPVPAARSLVRQTPIPEQDTPASVHQSAPVQPARVAAPAPQLDIARLSDEVYRHIQRKVRIDRERRGL